MSDTNDDVPEILQAVEVGGAVYFLRVDPEEGDDAGAPGHVFKLKNTRKDGEVPVQVLASNDTLRTLWASPSGALWVASADGSVGTTAKVAWQAPADGTEYRAIGRAPKWSVTALPPSDSDRLPPNVTALWGTGDDDVYAGTDIGDIYRWDGRSWTQAQRGADLGEPTIRAFGGAAGDVFALGTDSTLLHFDGQSWRKLTPPGKRNGSETFTGLVRRPDGEVLIAGAGDKGRLLVGTAAALTELGRYPIELIDMAPLGDRILFATGNGVAELVGRKVKMIRETFETATMSAGTGRVFFFEPAPELWRGLLDREQCRGVDTRDA
ncbi:MAG: hypothetical protein J0I07_31015 [Myxococcales bacterium]|nr:hypothetical protein [Myxococcales bacterium]